jgi:hypothetical protein
VKTPVKTTKALLGILTITLVLVIQVQAQFNYTINNGAITITEYTGSGGAVSIPSTINGLPVSGIGESAFYHRTNLTGVTIPSSVTSIGSYAFYFCTSLTNVTIPNSVTSIGSYAFYFCTGLTSVTIPNSVANIGHHVFKLCTSLTSVTIPNSVANVGRDVFYFCDSLTNVTTLNRVTSLGDPGFNCCTILKGACFKGNAPAAASDMFSGDTNTTVQYMLGTTGWGATFAARRALLWNPQVQTSDASFGPGPNGFGFTISGTANIPILIEACTNFARPLWVSLQSCTLTNGSLYFSDPEWKNYPARFYRIRSP